MNSFHPELVRVVKLDRGKRKAFHESRKYSIHGKLVPIIEVVKNEKTATKKGNHCHVDRVPSKFFALQNAVAYEEVEGIDKEANACHRQNGIDVQFKQLINDQRNRRILNQASVQVNEKHPPENGQNVKRE